MHNFVIIVEIKSKKFEGKNSEIGWWDLNLVFFHQQKDAIFPFKKQTKKQKSED